MAGLSGHLTRKVVELLMEPKDGVDIRVAAIQDGAGEMPLSPVREVIMQNAGVETVDKAGNAKYPALCIYCEKLSNTLKEKFRAFSGKASVVVEIRYSQDHLEAIESRLQVYVDAVCALLGESKGDWQNGVFYTGGYEVSYEAATKGGKNYLQRAKVKFEVEVSR